MKDAVLLPWVDRLFKHGFPLAPRRGRNTSALNPGPTSDLAPSRNHRADRQSFFLPWHLDFFCGYRPLLERVLRDGRETVHRRLADALWDAADEGDAVARFVRVDEELPPVAGEMDEVATAHG